jgi:exonuclease SbcC
MKIKQVIIEGFRAYQSKADGTFDLTTPSGDCADFVSIYAPNGFGKTSFYDAVEWNLTNNIGRFVRDQTRVQNNAISRSQNQGGRKQYILRNRFIADDAPSQVTVITDSFEIIKKVPSARRGSRDYHFEKEQPDEKTGDLGDVFLSQEAIDAFLREEKPESRYARFMASLGDEDEVYRGNLTTLKRDLNNNIAKAKEEEAQHLKVAQSPINPSILENLNSTISTLQQRSEKVPAFGADLGVEDVRSLRSLITKRSHDLGIEIKDADSAILELNAEVDKVHDFSAARDRKVLAQTEIAELGRVRNFVEKREGLLRSIARSSKTINEFAASVSRINSIAEYVPEFVKFERRVAEASALLRALQNDLIATQVDISSFEQRASECRRLLEELESNANALKNLQRNAEAIFQQIDAALQQREIQLADAATANLRVQLLKRKIENQEEDLRRVEAIEVSEDAIDFADASALAQERFSLVSLKSALLEKRASSIALQAATTALDQVQDQVSQFTTLIALGTELVTKTHSDQCPLCSYTHNSHSDLIDRILDNPALTQYEAEAIRVKEAAQRQHDLASNNLVLLLQEWGSLKNKATLEIREVIAADEARLRSALKDSQQLALQIHSIDENIKKLRSEVLDRSSDQFSEYSSLELESLDSRRQSELKDLESCTVEAEARRQKFKVDSQSAEEIRAELQLISGSDVYINVKAFIVESGTTLAELPNFIATRKSQLEHEIQESRISLKLLSSELSEIEKHSPNLLQLTRQSIDDAEVRGRASIASADVTLMKFASNMRRHILDYDDQWSALEITKRIASFTSQTEGRIFGLKELLSTYSLLGEQLKDALPFIDSISAKRELERVSADILQQETLLSELNKEYAETIARLEQRVRGFFYTDLINSIYRKIDPHPDFKRVLFDCDFSESDRPRLNVLVADEKGETISPSLYFSAAQVNILSLSIFLARALHVKNADGNTVQCIFIDDPIHSMDSINVLSTIDLLRSISRKFDRQIILSTHDKNFFDLLRKKIPEQQYSSKFIELETFGRVRDSEDFEDVLDPTE